MTTTFEFVVSYASSEWDCPRAHLITCGRKSKNPVKVFIVEGETALGAFEAHEAAAYRRDNRYRKAVGAMCCLDPNRETRDLNEEIR